MNQKLPLILLLLVLVPVALADGIDIRGVKVYADSQLQYGSVDVHPNSNITITITIKNQFSSDDDIDLEDIEVKVKVSEIDDGDDLEIEFDEFDLEPGEEKNLAASFLIPYAIDEDTFPMEITARGDGDGVTYKDDDLVNLVVKKETHKVVVSDASFSSTPKCGESTVLNLEITDTGKEDEDNVILELESDYLGYSFRDTDIDLQEGEDDSQFSRQYALQVPANAKGDYTLVATLTYDDGDIVEKSFIPFLISCGETPTQEAPVQIPVIQKPVVQQPVVEQPSVPVVSQPSAPALTGAVQTEVPQVNESKSIEQESLLARIDDTTLLVAFAEILLVFFIVFIVLLIRRSK
ncbi:hypothetical protein HY638_03835 [Candidatus Woesearchaeota archaeon]|nr:hypothetical protein [Candidatus Woesearchaeota archaeon]